MRAFVFLLLLLVSARVVQGEPVSLQNQVIGKKTTARQHAPDSVLAAQLRCHFQAMDSNAAGPERRAFNNQLARFYAARNYRPVWTERADIAELIEAIGESENDGLIPDDYHIKEIRTFFLSPPRTPELQAKYDLLLSDALLSLAYHLRFGKVDPESLDPNWNLDGTARRTALEYRLQNALAAGRPKAALDELRPKHSGYAELKKGLARYRVIARAGGWQKVPEGDSFREGVRDSRVPLLRKRLQQSGDLPGGVTDSSKVYTAAMAN
ncbi:MAG: murein L,D-transpeptidase, partial [Chlorobium limicola]|nr:murein L,D-transpeptidase [Chlorobium limicola]